MKYISLDNISKLLDESTVLLYPTDTIYGLGGLVTPQVVDKINTIKQRPAQKHYSLIAPDISRIQRYCAVQDTIAEQRESYKASYPGRGLTIIFPLNPKRPDDVDFSLITKNDMIGVRLLDHPLQTYLQQRGKPLITTSANISGQPNIIHPSQLTKAQYNHIDYIIDAGYIDQLPSVIIDYATNTCIRA